MLQLPLADLHRKRATTFVAAMGYELPESFGDPAEEQGRVALAAGLIDRSYRGALEVSGPDARGFLDGLLSSPVRGLEPGRFQPSCFLSPRGRVLAALRLEARDDGAFRLALSEPVRPAVLDGLRKYAVLSGVEVRDVSGDSAILAVEGPRAREALLAVLPADAPPPAEAGRVVASPARGGGRVEVAAAGESPEGGFELRVPRDEAAAWWEALEGAVASVGGGPVGHEAAEALRLEAGLPRYGREVDEETFPGEVGLEGSLSFGKCYVGQEIVARMRTYGHANRRLVAILGPETGSLPAGGRLLVAGAEAGRATSTGRSARLGRWIGLGLVHRTFWEAAEGEVEAEGARVRIGFSRPPLVPPREGS